MNRDGIAGRWRRLKGLARELWGRATGARKRQLLRKASEKQLADWSDSQHKNDPIHK